MASAAFADDINNDLAFDVDAADEVMNLTAGGAAGTTLLLVETTNGDGKNGCNLTGSTTLVVSVASSDTAVATVSPGSVTFDSCGATPTLTVTPLALGSVTISLSETSNNTDGSFNLAPATFIVNVAAAMPNDSTPPTITYALNPTTPDGANDWYKSDVTLTWTVTEDESLGSLVKTGCVDQNITVDQAPTTYSCSAESDGGSAGPVSVTIKRDGTAPSVVYTSASGTAGTHPWYTSNVTATFTATDNLSGFGPNNSPTTTGTATSAGEGSAVVVSSPSFTDDAGNTAAAGLASETFSIDLTDPTNVAFVGGPADGSSHYFGSVPAAPTCTADDAISGLASCTVTGYSSSVGTHTLTATATDNAGRTATATRTYSVLAWTIGGFYRPVDMDRANTAKAGSTVPLKFEVFAGPTELTDTAVVGWFTQKIGCESGLGDDIEEYATGNTSLRYDESSGQFIFNWKTPSQKGACYRVTLKTLDGSSISAIFSLK